MPQTRTSRLLVLALAVTSAIASAADPAGQLIDRINKGEVKLEYKNDGWGYLSDLLAKLDINKDSQTLVFSKTSLQQSKISPKTPRALYFNDNVSVGAVQNGELYEITSLDPKEGIVFYALDVNNSGPPVFEKHRALCIQCHNPVNSYATGLMVATVYPGADGSPFFTNATTLFVTTDHTSPFEDRWGGWYVTGTHGTMMHKGNAVANNPYRPIELETKDVQNVTDLSKKFDVSKYLAPTSDLIALMTLEHQTKMINLITSVSNQFRYSTSNELPPKVTPTPAMLDKAIDDIVRYMLFIDEFPLTSPIKGVSTFTETFPKRGPVDAKGRSLRDFDLKTRLFRYPLSYMIYSDLFDGMNPTAKDRIYRRLYGVLTGKEVLKSLVTAAPEPPPTKATKGKSVAKVAPKAPPERVTAADRQAILEILLATKPNLPDYWKAPVATASLH